MERATEYHIPLCLSFMDLTKVYDSVDQQALIAVVREYRVPSY